MIGDDKLPIRPFEYKETTEDRQEEIEHIVKSEQEHFSEELKKGKWCKEDLVIPNPQKIVTVFDSRIGYIKDKG